MYFGKFRFENYNEFVTAQNLAQESGYKTIEDFEKFLVINYSNKLIK